MEFTKEDGNLLIKLARQSIKEEFSNKKPPVLNKLKNKKFAEKLGVFVTLTKDDKLRGCIGYPYPSLPLKNAVQNAAKQAAFSDPRFLHLNKSELKKIKIEISVLSLPQKCKPADIEIGKHGIMCDYKGKTGLLLPQVATEHNLNQKQFLQALCNKSFLPLNSYKDKEFKLQNFECVIFKE